MCYAYDKDADAERSLNPEKLRAAIEERQQESEQNNEPVEEQDDSKIPEDPEDRKPDKLKPV